MHPYLNPIKTQPPSPVMVMVPTGPLSDHALCAPKDFMAEPSGASSQLNPQHSHNKF